MWQHEGYLAFHKPWLEDQPPEMQHGLLMRAYRDKLDISLDKAAQKCKELEVKTSQGAISRIELGVNLSKVDKIHEISGCYEQLLKAKFGDASPYDAGYLESRLELALEKKPERLEVMRAEKAHIGATVPREQELAGVGAEER